MQRHIDAIQTPIPSMRIVICILGILHILTSCDHGQIGVDAAITLRENQLKDKLGYDY